MTTEDDDLIKRLEPDSDKSVAFFDSFFAFLDVFLFLKSSESESDVSLFDLRILLFFLKKLA